MVSWEVPPAALLPFVPRGTELDDRDGRHYASMVGFRFTRTRLRGIAIPFHQDFDEVNLRFYVRRRVDGGWRRAAVFVSEIVPMPAIAWTAKLLYNERYRWCRMRHRISADVWPSVQFEWRAGQRWHQLAAVQAAAAAVPAADSLDAFISEHYYGYSAQRDGGTLEYAVQHPQWRLAPVRDIRFDADVARLYGAAFAAPLAAAPANAFLAEGSDVTVHAGVRLP